MKKMFALMAGVALLFTSTIVTSCSDSVDDSSSGSRSVSSSESSSKNNGSIVGVVLDNKGEPVEGATVTLGSKSAKTNDGGEFEIIGVSANDTKKITVTGTDVVPTSPATTPTTAYKLTAKKDGYLSATVTGIYVTYQDTDNRDVVIKNAALTALEADYKAILTAYATALNPASSTVSNGAVAGTAGSTATTSTTQIGGADAVVTTTTQTGSDSATVFKDVSEAISALKNLYESGYYTEYFADFADFSGANALIPCDASLKGKIKLNLKAQGASTYAAETYSPASQPIVHVSCANGGTDYTWETKTDKDGNFSFDKNLPSGTALTVTVDMFFETINSAEYCFSTKSAVVVDENSGAETAGALNAITLGSKDANDESIILMLFAQNDKIWITDTNVDSSASGVLLKTTEDLTFTFNKAMVSADFTNDDKTNKITNLTSTEYTATWSVDKKTVTLKPVIGYWILTGDGSAKIKITGETEDGATTVLTKALTAYFDTKVWVSLKEESVSYKDYNDYIALDSAITLVFSKPMNDKVAVKLTNNSAAYTESWNTDKTELTLTPVAKAKYWDVTAGKDNIEITVDSDFASSQDYYNNSFGYWKTGAKEGKLYVYVDNFVDVEVAKAEVTGKEAFTLTFSKALKAFDAKTCISSVEADGTAITDYDVAIDATNKVLTFTSKNAQFNKKGIYKVTFTANKLVAENGAKIFRNIGTAGTADTDEYSTDFRFDGFEFKPTAIEVVDSVPATAVESRAIVSVTTAKALKFTFNKEVQTSAITVTVDGSAVSPKNYIDATDKKVVYVPLDGVKKVNKAIVLGGTVTAIVDTNGSDNITFNAKNLKDWFDNNVTDFYIYSALNLTGTSLVKVLDHVTGKPELLKADPISAGGSVTFDFDADLTGYSASYKIFGLKDVDNDTAPTDIKPLVENGTATIAGKTVTVTNSIFKTKKTVGDIATYYLELRVNNAEGVKVFSSTSPYFASVTDSFEALAKGKGIYDAPATTNPDTTPNSNKNYGSFIVEVAEKNHLVATNLIKETKYSLAKSSYAKADALAAKSAITFTFDSLPAGATASYELYDIAVTADPKKPQVVTSGAATIADKVVTVQTDLLVSGKPTVEGKAFNVDTSATTGISTYYLKLEVKDAAGNVLFSTANAALRTPTSNDKRTDFEKAVDSNIFVASDSGKKDMFKVEVAPLAVEGLSWVKEDTDAFGTVKLDNDGKKTYKTAEQINPKAEVTITFNADIPAGSKYTYKITDGTNTVEETKTAKDVATATKEIKIQSDKLVAKTTTAQDYYIELTVLNGKDKIFATDSTYFGNASNFEKKNNTTVINAAKDAFNVKVIQTQIVKAESKVDGVESKTTANNDKGFQKSFKSPIVLQFTHPVTGYKVVLYNVDSSATPVPTKLYTSATESKTWKAPVEASAGVKATMYAEFKENNKEFIFDSNEGVVDTANAKIITVTPNDYYGTSKNVALAIFNEDGDYVAVKDNSITGTTYTYDNAKYVAFSTTNKVADLTKEILKDTTVAELPKVTADAKVGDNQLVVFAIDTDLSTLSDKVATYKLYVKNAEDTDYSDVTTSAIGYDNTTGVQKLYGVDTYNADKNAPGSVFVSRENKILGRADKTYIGTKLSATAFGIRPEGKVNVILVKEQDGKYSAYKAELSDKCPTDKITATNYQWISGVTGVIIAAADVSAPTITIPGIKSLDTTAGGAVTNEITAAAFKFDVEIGAGTAGTKGERGEYIKSVSGSVTKAQTNQPVAPAVAKTSKATITATYDTKARMATVTVADGEFYKGDEITLTVTDTNGNESKFIFKIQ